MTAKVIPIIDQRAASRVPVIPVPAPIPVGTLNRCMPGAEPVYAWHLPKGHTTIFVSKVLCPH